jgi:hypothetical protein
MAVMGGPVGIGTTSPSSKLSVQRDAVDEVVANFTGQMLVKDENELAEFRASDDNGFVSLNDGSEEVHIGQSSDGGDPYFFIDQRYGGNGFGQFVIDDQGTVGVNTTSPESGAALDVSGALVSGSGSLGSGADGTSVALGKGATASGPVGATALGRQTTASGGGGATALGQGTNASGILGATALGKNTTASGYGGATALGRGTEASGFNGATALGYVTTASGGDGATALGYGTTASGPGGATALGYGTTASESTAIAIGDSVSASSPDTLVIGFWETEFLVNDSGIQAKAGTNIDEFSVDEALADNSDSALPTEQSVKQYVDATAGEVNSSATQTLAEVLSQGDTANDGQQINIDEIRARDGDGVRLVNDQGNGITVSDSGLVSLDNIGESTGLRLDTHAASGDYSLIEIDTGGYDFWDVALDTANNDLRFTNRSGDDLLVIKQDTGVEVLDSLFVDAGLTDQTNITHFSTDESLADNSDDAAPTEQAIKSYVDSTADTVNSSATQTLAEVLSQGDTANDGQQINIDEIRARDGDGLLLADDNGNGLFVDEEGNVGIKTQNPDTALNINGNISTKGSDIDSAAVNAVALGSGTTAGGIGGIALGDGTNAVGAAGATALGRNTNASGYGATALGQGTTAAGYDAPIAIGDGATATGESSIAVGDGVTTTRDDTFVAGFDNQEMLFVDNTSIGIGTVYPSATLDVQGTVQSRYGTAVNEFSTDESLGGNSDNAVPTEQAVRQYAENNHFDPWILAGDSGSSTVTAGDTVTVAGGTGLASSVSSVTATVDVNTGTGVEVSSDNVRVSSGAAGDGLGGGSGSPLSVNVGDSLTTASDQVLVADDGIGNAEIDNNVNIDLGTLDVAGGADGDGSQSGLTVDSSGTERSHG